MRRSLDFDPGLPLLPVLDDPAAVVQLLAPGMTGAPVRRQDTKYQPATRCVAAFEIGASSWPPPAMGALVVTPDEVRAHTLERDPALPGLPEALDAAAMAARLAPLHGEEGAVRCVATPVRYKPGARCVIRYELTGGHRPAVYYGKVLAGDTPAQAALVAALDRALRTTPGAPRVPPLVAHWPELGLLVQPAVPQATEVHLLATDPSASLAQRQALLHRSGGALAALHACPLPQAPARSLAEDVHELRAYHPAVARADPALGSRFAALVERLAAGGQVPAGAAVTSHGAFRTDQLVVSGGALALIDLDTVCRAEPARDIGNLLAYLDWKAIRRPEQRGDLDAFRPAFLAGYAAVRPLPEARRLALCRAASLTKIAGRRFRSLTVAEWPLVPALLDAAERLTSVQQPSASTG